MPATAAPPSVAAYFIAGARRALSYAESLAKDIPASTFGHMPHPNMNHPAFNYGHLSLYPDRLLGMIGHPQDAKEKAGWADLFKAGVPCVEQDGRYPGKDEIVAHYVERYGAVIKAVESLPDEAFARENPMEGRMRELFPFVGQAVNFMLNNHTMMHLGQVSAWRRAMGMGSVM